MGLTLAREMMAKGFEDILVIEKESELGAHASGRNSGVLHAGIYYSPDTLKAKICIEGNFLMREYCKEKGLPILEKGKVIVARDESEWPALEELYNRATRNGAKVELIDEQLGRIRQFKTADDPITLANDALQGRRDPSAGHEEAPVWTAAMS